MEEGYITELKRLEELEKTALVKYQQAKIQFKSARDELDDIQMRIDMLKEGIGIYHNVR